jgi:hypothetical protein
VKRPWRQGCQPYAPASLCFFRNIFFLLLVLSFVRGWINPQGLMWPEGISNWNRFIYLIWSRTRDLPACIIVPEPVRYSLPPHCHRNVLIVILKEAALKYKYYIRTELGALSSASAVNPDTDCTLLAGEVNRWKGQGQGQGQGQGKGKGHCQGQGQGQGQGI